MKSVPVQLAIQGGGAKLIPLLGAMEAIAELEGKRVLRVTKIAATSAGAIAGALLAAPVDMQVVKTHLDGKAARLTRLYKPPGRAKKTWALLTNSTFWNVAELRDSLVSLFKQKTKLGQLEKPIRIVATDLKNLSKAVYADKDDPLVDSVLNSCAIPMFFRTFAATESDSALIVDGGLCANLPSEELTASPEDGEVIGISFETSLTPVNPTTIVSFTASLINAAIEHSVVRARQILGPNLLSLKTAIDTFDFQKALDAGLQTEWAYCYEQTKRFFEEYVASWEATRDANHRLDDETAQRAAAEAERQARQAERENELRSSLDLTRKTVRDVFDLHEKPKLLRYEQVSWVITAYSLADGQLDTAVRHSVFHASDETVYAYMSSTMTAAGERLLDGDFLFLDKDGNNVPFEQLHLESEDLVIDGSPLLQHRRIVYFRQPLRPDDPRAPFQLRTLERYSCALTKLRSREEDWLSLKVNRVAGIVPIVDIVLYLPNAFKGTFFVPGGLTNEFNQYEAFFPGEAIPTRVLNKEYPAPPGFFALGWRGTDVPPGTRFGCKIYPPKGARK
jgi:predicted acylesterase/phospholipase RssA